MQMQSDLYHAGEDQHQLVVEDAAHRERSSKHKSEHKEHKHKHKKHKHKEHRKHTDDIDHAAKSSRRALAARDALEVGSDVESGEIRGNDAEPPLGVAAVESVQAPTEHDRLTDSMTADRNGSNMPERPVGAAARDTSAAGEGTAVAFNGLEDDLLGVVNDRYPPSKTHNSRRHNEAAGHHPSNRKRQHPDAAIDGVANGVAGSSHDDTELRPSKHSRFHTNHGPAVLDSGAHEQHHRPHEQQPPADLQRHDWHHDVRDDQGHLYHQQTSRIKDSSNGAANDPPAHGKEHAHDPAREHSMRHDHHASERASSRSGRDRDRVHAVASGEAKDRGSSRSAPRERGERERDARHHDAGARDKGHALQERDDRHRDAASAADREHGRDRSDRRHRDHERDRGHDRAADRGSDRGIDRERGAMGDAAKRHEHGRERERPRVDDRGRDRGAEHHGGSRKRSRSQDRKRDERDRDRRRSDREHKADAGKQAGHESPEMDEATAAKLLSFGQNDEDEEQRLIEERRKRLQQIKAKHQQQAAQTESVIHPTASALSLREASEPPISEVCSAGLTPALDLADTAEARAATPAQGGDGDRTPEGDRVSSSDSGGVSGRPVLDIWGGEAERADQEVDSSTPAAQPALTQEPGMHTDALHVAATVHAAAAATAAAAKAVAEHKAAAAAAGKEEAGEDDMFADAADDMFADVQLANREGAEGGRRAGPAGPAPAAALADAYDDQEGYYNFQVGEIMDGRYEVFASNGKGVFSTVVRARDLARTDEHSQHPEVAIKLIRSNDTMYKAAQMEQAILRKLSASDPENRKHCIRLLRTFEYRNHFCLVFEPMAMNLRDLTKKYGRNKGLNIEAVQLFTCQLLIALRHLKKNHVLHSDIKPDNILINHRHNKVKLCDFGSAMLAGDVEVTPYLVSRFYRPPEVALGMKYDYAMDVWSIGCVIYELFTGKILFPGRDNNEMIKLMMDVKGPFTKKMLRKCAFVDKHFESDPNMSFVLYEDDPLTKTKVRRVIPNPSVKHNFAALLSRSSGDRAKIAQLADLLEKMMMLEPERRIDPDTALRHPFVKDFLPKKETKK